MTIFQPNKVGIRDFKEEKTEYDTGNQVYIHGLTENIGYASCLRGIPLQIRKLSPVCNDSLSEL